MLALDHGDMCANWDAVVEIDDVLIEQTNAAARDSVTDAFRLIRAVQPEKCIVAVPVKIKSARAKRIAEATV